LFHRWLLGIELFHPTPISPKILAPISERILSPEQLKGVALVLDANYRDKWVGGSVRSSRFSQRGNPGVDAGEERRYAAVELAR
jgi:hypothetical protein